MRRKFVVFSTLAILFVGTVGWFFPSFLWWYLLVGPLTVWGYRDMLQRKHTVIRNFPIIGNFRFWFENIRPEINQYFIESNSDGMPFSRERRSVVYQRAKRELDTLPFGTQRDVYEVGYEWVNHSLLPVQVDPKSLRITVGENTKQPYSASLLNISAMSFGSLSKNAILALNGGAKLGNFAHNTGEGGLSQYHIEPGGDVIWQIGTGYFSCRDKKGLFSPELFAERAVHPHVKMIEIKLSQGAKPGHGGILPAKKLTPEIADIRGVPLGEDVISPPAHSAFSTPKGLLEFVAKLRELSGGKPTGFKLCLGRRREFLAICKAMVDTKITPDFITVDGGEGGTGAAPLEFSNSVGCPLREGLLFVHNSLVGFSLRNKIKIIASGKITTGFDMITKLAMGADMCNAARAMMLALGCIQALRCNTNKCPVGVATQDPELFKGLSVSDKKVRVANYHHETIRSLADLIGAMGLSSPKEIRPWHLHRRTAANEVKHYGELYSFLKDGELLNGSIPSEFKRAWEASQASSFAHV